MQTFVDVPRLRMVTSHGYLTSGVGYAHHPHRDTWYSAHTAQLNWWLPVYSIVSERSMAFHPAHWSKGVKNGSSEFNYYVRNIEGRKNVPDDVVQEYDNAPAAEGVLVY